MDVGEALNMAHANVIVHQRTGAGQIFLKGVVLDTVLIRPSTVQSSVGLQTHLIADHQVCPVAEEHFGAAGLAVGRDLVGNLVRHTKEVASVHLIAVDRSKCKTAAQERTVLAHEAGHYMSGAFYRAYSPFEVKEQAEHRAFAASVEKYLPVNEILNCYKMGMTENWEIAEYFNLEEEFVEKAVHYWTDCKGIDFNCL